MSIDDDLAKALHLHETGDLLAAGTLYRQILQVDPDHVDALNLLGVVMQAAGDLELAVELTGRAAELAPDYFAPLINLGNALQASGRVEEAAAKFEQALELNPDAGIAANNLASALNELGRHDDALAAAERAVALMAGLPDAHVNRGNALMALGEPDAAVAAYTQALELDPMHATAWFDLGNAHMDLGDADAAVEPYRKAAQFVPNDPGRHYNLGNALQQSDRFAEAIGSFEKAIALDPDYTDARCNLAAARQSLGETEAAVSILREALLREPDSIDLHWNLSLALLQNGDMGEGWREYEWRWRTPTFEDFRRDFHVPGWGGEELPDGTLFIHAEQGFGDALQFVRYVPLAAARVGRLVLECRPELGRLFTTVEGVDERVNLGAAVSGFDAHVPMMSLPRLIGTTLESVPDQVPYLQVPADAAVDARLAEAPGLKVGIVWAGSPTRPDNAKRSCALALWGPVFDVPGVSLFSLQVGGDAAGLPESAVDLGPRFADFADTAAAVAALDLVISVDTSVLHLAGALGKPAWALLSQPTGFLWMNEREDSPWYPSLRLFRQPEPGAWGPVMAAVADALRSRVEEETGQ